MNADDLREGRSPLFIVNFKNYREVLGEGAFVLLEAAEKVSESIDVEIIVAPPVPSLQAVASRARIPVYSQRVDDREEGRSTGSIIPEAIKSAGCSGSILNHSESRIPLGSVAELVPRLRRLGLVSCVCAESPTELAKVVALSPDMVAIEPPELIGTGVAVSRAKPELVRDAVLAASDGGYSGRVLCGAGIASGEDAAAARRLGAEGVLVASSVVKAKDDWEGKLTEIASALVSGR